MPDPKRGQPKNGCPFFAAAEQKVSLFEKKCEK
jgi:hypothetical protein